MSLRYRVISVHHQHMDHWIKYMMIFLLLFDGCIEPPHMSEIDHVENHVSINDHTVIELDRSFLYDDSVDEIDIP